MFSVLGAVPLVVGWLGLFQLSQELAARRFIADRWWLHWALASTIWGVLVALVVEVASLFHWLNGPVLLSAWLFIDAILVFVLLRRRDLVAGLWKAKVARLRGSAKELPHDVAALFGMTALLALATFAIALLTPTTNWDSLTYHLPRMLHWLQQGSVEHFATTNFRQVEFPPWASYALLHLYVFGGGDQLLNLLQWCALLSTLTVAPGIVDSMASLAGCPIGRQSADERARWWRLVGFLCVVVATIPMGLIQSTTTQNDLVAIFWVCCAVAFGLALMSEPANPIYALATGAALGLGTLTKSTVFIYAAPLVLGFGWWWLTRLDPGRKLRVAGLAVSLWVLLNAPHMLRNQAACGSPLGSPQIFALERNERLGPAAVGSIVIRNLSLNCNTGWPALTRALNRGLKRAHQWTGMDLNDPATTYHGCRFFFREKFLVLDSYTSNTWHLALFAVALAAALFPPRAPRPFLRYASLVMAGVFLFCVYLKWQWWHSRLHLGFFVLFAPFAALALAEKLPRAALFAISSFLVFFGSLSLVKNQSRPVLSPAFRSLPREQQYMAVEGAHLKGDLTRVADAIIVTECKSAALNLAFDDAEYPLWIMLRNRGFDGLIRHVGASADADVIVESEESKVNSPCEYRWSHRFGYYTLRWKDQPFRDNSTPYSAQQPLKRGL